MSAPLAVNTTDGMVWLRRASTRAGLALYAPVDVCRCPEFVMATLPELAEHGISGSADALPVLVGPEPQPLSDERLAVLRKLRTHCEADRFESEDERPLHVWGPSSYPRQEMCQRCTARRVWAEDADADEVVLVAEVDRLRAQVSELLAERHSTNEALDDAVRALRAARDLCADCGHVEAAHAADVERPCDASGGRGSCTCAWFVPREGLRAPSEAVREGEPAEGCRHGLVDPLRPVGRCVVCGLLRNLPEAGASGQLVEWCTGCSTDHDPDECGYRPESGGAS